MDYIQVTLHNIEPPEVLLLLEVCTGWVELGVPSLHRVLPLSLIRVCGSTLYVGLTSIVRKLVQKSMVMVTPSFNCHGVEIG